GYDPAGVGDVEEHREVVVAAREYVVLVVPGQAVVPDGDLAADVVAGGLVHPAVGPEVGQQAPGVGQVDVERQQAAENADEGEGGGVGGGEPEAVPAAPHVAGVAAQCRKGGSHRLASFLAAFRFNRSHLSRSPVACIS